MASHRTLVYLVLCLLILSSRVVLADASGIADHDGVTGGEQDCTHGVPGNNNKTKGCSTSFSPKQPTTDIMTTVSIGGNSEDFEKPMGSFQSTSRAVQIYHTVRRRISDVVHFVIAVVAISGNSLNLLVLRGKVNSLSPYTYMTFLAASDLMAGVSLLLLSLISNRNLISTARALRVLCVNAGMVFFAAGDAAVMASNLLAMVLSIDRLIAVMFPLKRNSWCTVKRAKCISAAIVLLSLILCAHTPFRLKYRWVFEEEYGIEMPELYYTEFGLNQAVNRAARISSMVLKIFLPFLSMTVTNTLTLLALRRSEKIRLEMSRNAAVKPEADKRKWDKGQCVAVTVGVVVVFFITQAPMAARYTQQAIFGRKYAKVLAYRYFSVIGDAVSWTNTAMNFFIYTVLNEKFRRDIVQLLQAWKKKETPVTDAVPCTEGTRM